MPEYAPIGFSENVTAASTFRDAKARFSANVMRDQVFVFGGLAIFLTVATWALFRLIGWLRKTSARYFYFELFVPVFVLGFGLLFMMAPRGAHVPASVVGIASLLTGALTLSLLLARRFGWKWPRMLIDGETALRCSFCNRSQRDVKKLIAGPHVYICDECVQICLTILSESRDPEPEGPRPDPVAT